MVAGIDALPCGRPDGFMRATNVSDYFLQIKSTIENNVDEVLVQEHKLPSTPFETIKNERAPIDLRIRGCTSNPCIIYTNSTLYAEWDFVIGKFEKLFLFCV